jgi:hypothetical protein
MIASIWGNAMMKRRKKFHNINNMGNLKVILAHNFGTKAKNALDHTLAIKIRSNICTNRNS